MLRIIDYKKIELTDDEWALYQEICKSYDRPNFKGSDLFQDLFETNSEGVIVFLKPPKSYTSMEIFLFMMSVMQHQHLRVMYSRIDDAVKETKDIAAEVRVLIAELKSSRE